MYKRIFKSRYNVKIDGVCSGIAYYFNVDPTVVRILWVFASILTFPLGPIAYLICSLIIPREPNEYDQY